MLRKTSSNNGSGQEERESSPPLSSKDDEELVFGHFSRKSFVMYMTHFNIVLYALCYWIQIGVLPVSHSCGSLLFRLFFSEIHLTVLASYCMSRTIKIEYIFQHVICDWIIKSLSCVFFLFDFYFMISYSRLSVCCEKYQYEV